MLLRKYGLEEDEEEESGLAAAWKKKIEKQNWENWQEEVDKKSSLKWYKKVKEENGPEKYVGSWESHVAVQLRFWLRWEKAKHSLTVIQEYEHKNFKIVLVL